MKIHTFLFAWNSQLIVILAQIREISPSLMFRYACCVHAKKHVHSYCHACSGWCSILWWPSPWPYQGTSHRAYNKIVKVDPKYMIFSSSKLFECLCDFLFEINFFDIELPKLSNLCERKKEEGEREGENWFQKIVGQEVSGICTITHPPGMHTFTNNALGPFVVDLCVYVWCLSVSGFAPMGDW